MNSKNEIPDRPHPNCKCHVEPFQEEELCDCYTFIEQIDELIGDAESLQEEVEEDLKDYNEHQYAIKIFGCLMFDLWVTVTTAAIFSQ